MSLILEKKNEQENNEPQLLRFANGNLTFSKENAYIDCSETHFRDEEPTMESQVILLFSNII